MIIFLSKVCSVSVSQSKLNIDKAIPLWHNILIQTKSSQKNKMQNLPFFIWWEIWTLGTWSSQAESSPSQHSYAQSPLSPLWLPSRLQLVTLDHLTYMENTSGFGVFWQSTVQHVTLFPQYSLQYFLLRYSSSEHTSLEELHPSETTWRKPWDAKRHLQHTVLTSRQNFPHRSWVLLAPQKIWWESFRLS